MASHHPRNSIYSKSIEDKMQNNTLPMNQYIKEEILGLDPSNIHIIENYYNYNKEIIKSWLAYNGIDIPIDNIHINLTGQIKSSSEIKKNSREIIKVLKSVLNLFCLIYLVNILNNLNHQKIF